MKQSSQTSSQEPRGSIVIEPPPHIIAKAIAVGAASPCAKSKRGVAIFYTVNSGLVSEGTNHPPRPFVCSGDQVCRAACGKLCVHAEAAALLNWSSGLSRSLRSVDSFDMVHVKVVEGELVASGPPSCWQCSRLILEAGIKGMWLFHEDGWCRYEAEEFHQLTLEHCDLPVTRAESNSL